VAQQLQQIRDILSNVYFDKQNMQVLDKIMHDWENHRAPPKDDGFNMWDVDSFMDNMNNMPPARKQSDSMHTSIWKRRMQNAKTHVDAAAASGSKDEKLQAAHPARDNPYMDGERYPLRRHEDEADESTGDESPSSLSAQEEAETAAAPRRSEHVEGTKAE
jgi:hypothetical protein